MQGTQIRCPQRYPFRGTRERLQPNQEAASMKGTRQILITQLAHKMGCGRGDKQGNPAAAGAMWSGVEWSGMEWCGVVWSSVEWCGAVWSGVERCGKQGQNAGVG